MNSNNYIPYCNIPEELEICKGDILLISADITKIGLTAKRKENSFDLNRFIDAFIQKIQPEGTLLIPAYNYLLESGDKFDVKNTLPITGAMAVEALKRADFKRTAHPLHSFAVTGRYQEELCNLANKSSFGPDSPFAFLYQKNAKLLLIDLNLQSSLTFTHFVEETEKVKYRFQRNMEINYTDEKGETSLRTYSLYKKYPWITLDFNPLEKIIEPAVIQAKEINGVNYRILDLNKVYTVIKEDIKNNNAKSISKFSLVIFCKSFVKSILKKLNIYSSPSDKIRNADLR